MTTETVKRLYLKMYFLEKEVLAVTVNIILQIWLRTESSLKILTPESIKLVAIPVKRFKLSAVI